MTIKNLFCRQKSRQRTLNAETARTEAAPGDALLFVVEHEVSAEYDFDQAASVSDITGLKFCELLGTPEGSRRLVSFWNSKDNYILQASFFSKRFRVDKPVRLNWQFDLLTKERSRWDRFTRPDLQIATLAALVGGLGTILGSYGPWFAKPQVELYPADNRAGFDLLEKTEGDVRLVLKNLSGWHQVSTQLRQTFVASAEPASTQDVRAVTAISRAFPALQMGDAKEISLTIPALSRGKYLLRAEGQAKAGLFYPRKHFSNSFPIEVWPKYAFSEPMDIREFGGGSKCQYNVDLITGQAFSQLRCLARLAGVPGVKFIMVVRSNKPEGALNEQPGLEMATMTWETAALPALHREPTRFSLQSTTNRTLQEWTAICRKVHYEIAEVKGQ